MASNRLAVLSRQLTAGAGSASEASQLDFSPDAMARALVHDNWELRHAIYNFLAQEPIYKPNHYLSLMETRELTLQRLKKFVTQRFFSVHDYKNDPRRFMAGLEALFFADYSLAIKAGVHFTLCGGTICRLGTKKHHDTYLDRLDTLDLTGSFGMTELGHGSNVMGIETTATYDAASKEFVINSPTHESGKAWIGGTAQHGKLCAVFAQLTINGKWEGPHVFMVRIRDDQLRVMPGVRIVDHGPKMGLNGVDNGMVWFDHVRVPRDAMLDAFATVGDDGSYRSPIASVSQRFGTMVSGLTTGRILIAQGGVDSLKIGLFNAIRYSCQRPQFGDKVIMSYVTHQQRLLPLLANTYALHLAMGSLKDITDRKNPKDAKTVHLVSSGLKAAATWSKVKGLQDCRECCGGMGFLSANKIGVYATDTNIDVTFEGDNTVLMQQVARGLLDDKANLVRPQPPSGPGPAQGGATLPGMLALLQFRERALAAKVGGAIAGAAAAAAAGGKAEAEKAATRAFEEQLDTVVAIGWAYVERYCLDNFCQVLGRVDASLRPALELLANLYALDCLAKDAAFFLGSGTMTAADVEAVRAAMMRIYALLTANGGRLAVKLCDGFGLPEPLVSTPISQDWRTVGVPAL